jgi:hypothetical protein
MFGLIFKNNAINNINASITFFMPSPPSHTIVAAQAKSDRGDVDLGPKKCFVMIALISMSSISITKYPGEVNMVFLSHSRKCVWSRQIRREFPEGI